jgi:plastocyanin
MMFSSVQLIITASTSTPTSSSATSSAFYFLALHLSLHYHHQYPNNHPSLIMVAFTSLAFAVTTLIGLTTAIPAQHIRSTGVIHRITAGSTTANKGLHFEPENVSANIGDIIQFHFMPKNHSVVQSSFDKPCEPLSTPSGIFSGFNFATQEGEADNVFSFVVKDTKPFWYYCSQTVGNHCQMGMSGVINQDFGSEKTLVKYKMAAVNTTTKQPSADPKASQGGWISPNVAL